MENCFAAAALNGVDGRSLQRSARLGQEVLERAKRRAVNWHSQERPKGSMGSLSREGSYQERQLAAGPHPFLPGEVRAWSWDHSFSRRWPAGFQECTPQKHLRDSALGPWRKDGKYQDNEWKNLLKSLLLTDSCLGGCRTMIGLVLVDYFKKNTNMGTI